MAMHNGFEAAITIFDSRFVGQSLVVQEAIQDLLKCDGLIRSSLEAGALHCHESESLQLPDETANLVFSLVLSGNPPLPPVSLDGQMELVLEVVEPDLGASDGDRRVHVARVHPLQSDNNYHSHVIFDEPIQEMVGPVAASVLSPDPFTAGLPFVSFDFSDVPVALEIGVVKIGDWPDFILAAHIDGVASSSLVAFSVDVVGRCVGSIIFCIECLAFLVAFIWVSYDCALAQELLVD